MLALRRLVLTETVFLASSENGGGKDAEKTKHAKEAKKASERETRAIQDAEY